MYRKQRGKQVSAKTWRELNANLTLSDSSLPAKRTDETEQPEAEKTIAEGRAFYRSEEWQKCRTEFLEGRERICAGCDLDLNVHGKLNVDHIAPLRHFWDRRCDLTNLQILCEECNELKGNKYPVDIRKVGRRAKTYRKEKQIQKEKQGYLADLWERDSKPRLIKASELKK
jgi:hypothetical protein